MIISHMTYITGLTCFVSYMQRGFECVKMTFKIILMYTEMTKIISCLAKDVLLYMKQVVLGWPL